MRSVLSTALLAALCHHASGQLYERDFDLVSAPQGTGFLQRAYHSSVIVGNFLYIDGGEISQLLTSYSYANVVMNQTLSVDLSSSWTSDSVKFRTIDKNGAPSLNYQTLWLESDHASFYSYGGEESWTLKPVPPPPPQGLWKFTTDGNGGGSWSQQTASSNSIFPDLVRQADAVGTYGKDTGYLLGGNESPFTTQDLWSTLSLGEYQPVPGIISYNMTSGVWRNDSSAGYSRWGTAIFARAVYAPSWGEEGLLAFLGGAYTNLEGWKDDGSNLIGMDDIAIYDPAAQKWYHQTTTGDVPAPRTRFCAVGAQGENNSFEIYIYGGHADQTPSDNTINSTWSIQATANYDAVYVLSIPAFEWFKANYTPHTPRVDHTCNVAGNRQMLSVGGTQFLYADWVLDQNTTDPFKQGLGIFDMTEMSWSDRYDADAKPYESPRVVKERYQRKGRRPDHGWDDEGLQDYFKPSSKTSSNTTASPTASPGAAPKHHSSSHTGAIVGGVIGGVVLVTLLITTVWFTRRQRQRRSDSSQELPLKSKLDTRGPSVSQAQYELNASSDRHDAERYELDPLKRHEVPGSEAPRYELDSGRGGLGR